MKAIVCILFSLIPIISAFQAAPSIGQLTKRMTQFNGETPPSFDQVLKVLKLDRKEVLLVKGGLGQTVMKCRCVEKDTEIYFYLEDPKFSADSAKLIRIEKHNASTEVNTPLWEATGYFKKKQLQQDPAVKILGRIHDGINSGDSTAFDEIQNLSGMYAMSELVLIFRARIFEPMGHKPTPVQTAFILKCAELVPQISDAEAYFKQLWQKPTLPKTGALPVRREAAFNLLAAMNNKFAVRVLCEALSEPDIGEQAALIHAALLKMDIPTPPYPKNSEPDRYPEGAVGPEGLAKWKQWW